MRLFMNIIYLFWPALLWGAWLGLSRFGHEGWGMDLLYIVALAITALIACVIVAANIFMSKM